MPFTITDDDGAIASLFNQMNFPLTDYKYIRTPNATTWLPGGGPSESMTLFQWAPKPTSWTYGASLIEDSGDYTTFVEVTNINWDINEVSQQWRNVSIAQLLNPTLFRVCFLPDVNASNENLITVPTTSTLGVYPTAPRRPYDNAQMVTKPNNHAVMEIVQYDTNPTIPMDYYQPKRVRWTTDLVYANLMTSFGYAYGTGSLIINIALL